ncbi:hypothetical protein JCM11641_000470 [Rhodosporidiobolus odoratus]
MAAHDPQKANLNVRDALSYLDRVKLTFQDQTEVYDRFLTIMKDFKSQGIDTPGVIDRVSTLFRGHPGLIQGFNTFLPPGYRIECAAAQDASSGVTTITVTTPMGMTTRTQLTGEQAAQATVETKPDVAPDVKPDLAAARPQAPPPPSSGLHLQNLPAAPNPTAMQASTPIATPGAATLLSNQMAPAGQAPAPAQPAPAAAGDPARPPMEFNHAITYVNKIKNRFIREPETYKAFLEILQTYQKEGRAIQDVYAQVTTLFGGAPDLLDEFKQFLPDTSADANAANPDPVVPEPSPSGRAAPKRTAPSNGKRLDEAAAKRAKTGSSKNGGTDKSKGKRKAETTGSPLVGGMSKDRAPAGMPPADMYDMPVEQSHLAHSAAAYYYPPVAGQAAVYPPSAGPAPVYAYDPPAPAPPPAPLLPPKPVPSAPDLAFFARVKAHAKDQTIYHEFLKLMNLYTNELIDLTALISRAWLFLHQDQALWNEFKEITGWTDGVEGALGEKGKRVEVIDGKRVIENVPREDGENWRKSKGDAGKRWETYGPSYRKLPPAEISLNCSGRDALCWEVLNDEWVSQPSYASDEGFVAQRRNPYEEALHRSEEERHEYDYHIEANLRTIALLEPIATRIAVMEPEERATFRLKPGLGNQSKSIYQRVIKKVYGKEQGLEVIQALHENPCVAVPIVLARLKQKDEEWKRSLREWNRVWRESDAKNFLRSLDHQAIALKANDKRYLTTKALVSEIEAVKRDQGQRAYGSQRPSPPPRWQLSYPVDDRQAVFDATRLILSFLDRTYVVAFAEKPKVESFLQEFLALAFAIPSQEFDAETGAARALAVEDEDNASLIEALTEAALIGAASGLEDAEPAASTGNSKKKKGGDLRKKALKKTMLPAADGGSSSRARKKGAAAVAAAAAAAAAQANSAPSSRAASPVGGDVDSTVNDGTPAVEDVESALASAAEGSREVSMDLGTAGEDSTSPALDAGDERPGELIVPVEEKPVKLDKRKTWNLFCNSTLYNLLRLFQILQSRLAQLRSSAVVLSVPPTPEPITPSHVPSLSKKLTYAPPSGDGWTLPSEHYYQRALGICEKMFEGEIDQAMFEDALRSIMATQGYILFTIDKILSSILKLSHTACTEHRTRELVDLLRKDRAHPDHSAHAQQLVYRTQAETTLTTEENFYRIEWTPTPLLDQAYRNGTPVNGHLRFQLMGKDAVGPEDLPTLEREWAKYVEGFVKLDKTPNLPLQPRTPYLPRNLRHLGIPPPADSASSRPSLPSNLLVAAGLQTRICLRSYRLFFSPDTEDVLFRLKYDESAPAVSPEKRKEIEEKKASRVEGWLEKRKEVLGLFKDRPAEAPAAQKDLKEPAPTFAAPRAARSPVRKLEIEAEAAEEKEKVADEPAAGSPAPPAAEGKKDGEDVEMK